MTGLGVIKELAVTASTDSDQRSSSSSLLASSGIRFETVDPSETGGKRRLAEWIGRVRETPVLLVEDGRRRRYEGVRAIFDYVESQRNIVTVGKEVNLR